MVRLRQLIDLNVTNLNQDDLTWADYAFVSAMTVQHDSPLWDGRFIK